MPTLGEVPRPRTAAFVWMFSVALLVAGCLGNGRHAPTTLARVDTWASPTPTLSPTPPGPPNAEEYAVYSALINDTDFLKWPHSFPGAKGGPVAVVVIMDHTLNSRNPLLYMPDTPGSWPGTMFESLPDAMLRDFKALNGASYPLENRFETQIETRLITREQLDTLFKSNGNGWDRFYKKYPHGQGILSLSRVAFDAEKTVALVYAGCQRHWKAGAGFFFLLQNVGGKWAVVSKQMTWIS